MNGDCERSVNVSKSCILNKKRSRKTGPRMNVNRGSRSGKTDHVVYERASDFDMDRSVPILCCVDDTDDISGETSTGYVAENIAKMVSELGGKVSLGITRHQLLLDDNVEYTSHNSSMCFAAYLPEDESAIRSFRDVAISKVLELSVQGSDPGLCILNLSSLRKLPLEEAKRKARKLIEFGHAAQVRVCTKEEAYSIADDIPGLDLSEHGGDGNGIIGALAGVGLRFEGEDGRFRGTWNLEKMFSSDNISESCVLDNRKVLGQERESVMTASDFRNAVSEIAGGGVCLVDRSGLPIDPSIPIALVDRAKPILSHSKLTFIVDIQDEVGYPTFKTPFDEEKSGLDFVCEFFEYDNDIEECDPFLIKACRNCLLRRWDKDGFECTIR